MTIRTLISGAFGAGLLGLSLLAVGAARADTPPNRFGASADLEAEALDNFQGGLHSGSGGNTLFRGALWMNLPGGGRLRAGGIAVYGDQPDARYVGDTQVVSNIDASRRQRLYEFWYRQPLGKQWSVTAGLIPADDYFDVTDSAGLLLNASFGVGGTLGDNLNAPIYPTAGVGAMATWRSGPWSNRAGLFQADPNDRGSALHRGALLMDELAYSQDDQGTYKIGVWGYHPRDPGRYNLTPRSHGGWLSLEHTVTSTVWGFLRGGWSPDPGTLIRNEVQVGFQGRSFVVGRPKDQYSLGVTRANLRGSDAETTWEATWLFAVNDDIGVQPDIQYVRHPSGNLPSAWVGLLRLRISLD